MRPDCSWFRAGCHSRKSWDALRHFINRVANGEVHVRSECEPRLGLRLFYHEVKILLGTEPQAGAPGICLFLQIRVDPFFAIAEEGFSGSKSALLLRLARCEFIFLHQG